MDKLLDGIERQARGDRHRPPGDDRGRPARRARAGGRRARAQRAAERGRRAAHLAPRRHAVGARGHAGGRRPARLADDRRPHARGARRPRRASRARPRPTGCTDAVAARHGRLEPGARGVPALRSARRGRPAPARARLDGRRRGRARSSDAIDARHDAVRRLVEVRRDDRDARRSSSTSTSRQAATARTSSRSPTPARRCASSAREHGFRRVFVNDPDIGGRYSALSYFGLVPAALIGVDVGALLEGAPGRRPQDCERRPERQLRPVARAARSASWRCAGRDKLDVRRRRADRASACGSSSSSPSRPASRARASCPSPTSRSARPRPTATTASSCTCATPTRPTRDAEAGRALAEAGHPTITVRADGADDLGRIFFFSEFATAVAGWVLEINPFDQPNVQEAKDNTKRGARARAPPELDDGDARRRCSTAPRRRATSRSWATCPTPTTIDAAIADLRARDPRPRTASRRRSATARATCTRPASSTRAARRRAASCSSSHDADEDVDDPGRAVHASRTLERAQADGDLQTLRAHGLPAVRVRLPPATWPAPSTRPQGAALACRSASSASAGWAATWSPASSATPTTRSSPSTSTPRPSSGRQGTAPTGAASLEDLVAQARAAADGLDDGPGRRPDRSRPSTSSPSCSTRATRSSTAATRSGPTTCAAPRTLDEQGIHYVDVGTSGGVWGLEVGYCMMVGGPQRGGRAPRADPRRARRRPDGWRPLRPAGAATT